MDLEVRQGEGGGRGEERKIGENKLTKFYLPPNSYYLK